MGNISVVLRRIACLALFLSIFAAQIHARAPLVSLTVSIIGNKTKDGGGLSGSYQATFDRSDYTYPLPQTGFTTFGFSGELYVPGNASCADEVIGTEIRKFEKPMHPNGVAFLPYRTCRTQWGEILHQEALAGRAAGALLYSLKDDAAQASERAIVDPTYLQIPVWVVNVVAGEYLVDVMKQVYSSSPDSRLPVPPTSVEYQSLQDNVKLAINGIVDDGTKVNSPRAFVTISRSAADVAMADRNFFLKAMVGVGITGIVCFVIAMVVRYFDCLRLSSRRLRGDHDGWQSGEAGPAFSGLPGRGGRSGTRRWAGGGTRGGGSSSGAQVYHHHHHHHHHSAGGSRGSQPTKRVLQQHELDLLPCMVVVSRRDPAHARKRYQPQYCETLEEIGGCESGSEDKRRRLRTCASCPQLAPVAFPPSGDSTDAEPMIKLQRIYSSVSNSTSNGNSSCDSHDAGVVPIHSRLEHISNVFGNAQPPPDLSAARSTWDSCSSSDTALECAICLEEINEGEVIRKLPCPHVFHSACIDRWLLHQSSVCPLCKRDTIFGHPLSPKSPATQP
ncbi:hypothetical protein LPJ74_006139 [Coemansia sp. RSA 1843]|nr:hypothetical protein LPJ74_006139 [Coemansia sp. RSA 1843]